MDIEISETTENPF